MKENYKIELKEITNQNGSLCFFEKGKEIDFDIKRIYYIYNFSENETRGFHAHKKLKQVMWCPHGSIKISFFTDKKVVTYLLDHPQKILIINKGYWREFTSLEKNSILCVGASEVYSEKDYIRDYKKYLIWLEEENEKNTF